MLRNVGTPDRIVRIIAGVLLIALPLLVSIGDWASWGSYAVGAILIATAVFSFCPIYAALGLSTRPKTPS